MSDTVVVAIISASGSAFGSVAVAVTALVLNFRLFNSIERRIDRLEDRVGRLEERMDAKLDALTGKVVELANRLTRLEER